MIRHTNLVRSALALALITLGGAGCFWLEPIAPHPPDASDGHPLDPDGGQVPDGGNLPDGGGDPDGGGEPLACGPQTPVPAGASVSQLHGERAWMYLDPGNTLLPGGGGLRLKLADPAAADVPVQVRSGAPGIVEPDDAWVCIPPGAQELVVGLQALAVGEAHLEVRVAGDVVATLRVNVVDGPPTFSLAPDHGYYNPQDTANLTLRLSHPSPVPVTVIATTLDGSEELAREVVSGEDLEHAFELEFADEPELRFRVSSPELEGEVTPDFRRAVRHLLISEVLLAPGSGFVELYNPTEETISLQSQELVLRAGRDNYTHLTTFADAHAVEARSYFLVGWGDYLAGSNVQLSSPTGLGTSRQLLLGRRSGNGKSMESVIDALDYQEGWVHGEQSLERKAWEGAGAGDMAPGGRYEFAGNAHDGDASEDFILRASPQPQSATSPPESFFGP